MLPVYISFKSGISKCNKYNDFHPLLNFIFPHFKKN